MSADNDILVFADEPDPQGRADRPSWKVLIVDDEPQVHSVTRLALRDVQFDEGELAFLSAYSGSEAEALLQEHGDIALVLLDIVMESSDAGLKVADFIRNQLRNRLVRIILRTGQPGNVPEREVINNYEINDYKTKTDLTAQKLYTVVMTALRSYRDMRIVQSQGDAMVWLVESGQSLFKQLQRTSFLSTLEEQIKRLPFAEFAGVEHWMAIGPLEDATLVAASEPWRDQLQRPLRAAIPELAVTGGAPNGGEARSRVGEHYLLQFCTASELPLTIGLLGISTNEQHPSHRILELWAHNIEVAYFNLLLNEQSQRHQAQLERQVDAQSCQIVDTYEEIEQLKAAVAVEHAKRAKLIRRLRATRH